ncbi:MAG TPA: hypothetical protein VMW75_02610 [Thermoanaerobaculia bacterium]|nr:hypothetical protein [Thermoanaerobaculia bacterium]
MPTLNVDAEPFALGHEREAFTLAEATEQELLQKVQQVLQQRLETGRAIGAAPRQVDAILEEAGVHPKNPQYAELVVRTNLMDAYNTGIAGEMRAPDVALDFPVWRYLGVRDGRQGKDHEVHFGKYFANERDFREVRGRRVFNCRCGPQPIYKSEWDRLEREGAQVETYAEPDGLRQLRRHPEGKPREEGLAMLERYCQAGENAGLPGPCPQEQAPAPAPDPKQRRREYRKALAQLALAWEDRPPWPHLETPEDAALHELVELAAYPNQTDTPDERRAAAQQLATGATTWADQLERMTPDPEWDKADRAGHGKMIEILRTVAEKARMAAGLVE